MKAKSWIPSFGIAGAGALLAFALKHDDSVIGVRLRPLGVILLVMGAMTSAIRWVANHWAAPQGNGTASTRAQAIQSIGGLVAVAVGVGAVAALTLVTLTTVTTLDNTSIVAIATSAFGVISTVVGAFVGIKIGTDQTTKAVEDVRASATAVGVATGKLDSDQRTQFKADVADATTIARAARTGRSDEAGR